MDSVRLTDMQRRERYQEIFFDTLEQALGERFGEAFRVESPSASGGQLWSVQPILNAYHLSGATPVARNYLRDSFRYAPSLRRALPQFALGTALGTRAGLQAASTPAFRVTPAIPNAERQLIMPGNQRIRMFDFAAMRSHVRQKQQFPLASIQNEVSVRKRLPAGLSPTLLDTAPDHRWFDETLLSGFVWVRCPPWYPHRLRHERLWAALSPWYRSTLRYVDRADYVASRCRSIRSDLDALAHRHDEPMPNFAALLGALKTRLCDGAESVAVVQSHGDLQPGNLFVESSGHVSILDWERSQERTLMYDAFTFALDGRNATGLSQRADAWLQGRGPRHRFGPSWVFAEFQGKTAWPLPERRRALDLYWLDELAWRADEAVSGPYLGLSPALCDFHRELSRYLGDHL